MFSPRVITSAFYPVVFILARIRVRRSSNSAGGKASSLTENSWSSPPFGAPPTESTTKPHSRNKASRSIPSLEDDRGDFGRAMASSATRLPLSCCRKLTSDRQNDHGQASQIAFIVSGYYV